MNADKRGSGKSGGSGKLDIGKAKAHRGGAETRRRGENQGKRKNFAADGRRSGKVGGRNL